MRVEIRTIVVGCLEVNCYLVKVGDSLYIIDPGAEPDNIMPAARKLGGTAKAVLLTHGHVDHIGAAKAVADEFAGIPVYLHKDDHKLYFSPSNAVLPFLPPVRDLVMPTDSFISNDFQIIHTPGHSQGCVCFFFPVVPALFSGDTLFKESVGRTDLPGGDFDALQHSITKKIFPLPNNTSVYPGHGPATMIAHEKTHNVYLQNA